MMQNGFRTFARQNLYSPCICKMTFLIMGSSNGCLERLAWFLSLSTVETPNVSAMEQRGAQVDNLVCQKQSL